MKCDYCGQPGIQLTGETNGVLVCIDHAAKADTPRYTSADLTLEMSRRVEQAERRALDAEAELERLKAPVPECDHVWIDRPESDTTVCDLCGEER